MNQMERVFTIFLTFAAVSCAQLTLINGNSTAGNSELAGNFRIVAHINDNTVLSVGAVSENQNQYSLTSLDKTWDNSAFYVFSYKYNP